MTHSRFLSAIAFAGCLAWASPGEAQVSRDIQIREGRTLDDLKPGTRLRVLVPDGDAGQRLDGRFRGFGATSMMLEVNGANRELPISSILVVDESYRDRKRGALVGVLAVIVGVYAWDFFGPHPRYTDQDQRYRENVQALAIGLPAAVLIGGGIGWHRWRTISVAGR